MINYKFVTIWLKFRFYNFFSFILLIYKYFCLLAIMNQFQFELFSLVVIIITTHLFTYVLIILKSYVIVKLMTSFFQRAIFIDLKITNFEGHWIIIIKSSRQLYQRVKTKSYNINFCYSWGGNNYVRESFNFNYLVASTIPIITD